MNVQCLYAPVILIDSIYIKDEKYYSKVLSEKYCFIEEIEIYCSNSDEEYYNKECINLFLKNLFQSALFFVFRARKVTSWNIRSFLPEI